MDLLGWEHGVSRKQDGNLSITIHIVFAAVGYLRGLGLNPFLCANCRYGSKYEMWWQIADWELASKLVIWTCLHGGSLDPRDESCSCLGIGALTALS